MIPRFVLVLALISLLVTLIVTSTSPRHVSAQDLLPTPVGQLGGPMPLPTAPAPLGGSLPQETPEPSRHPLVGAWLLTFTEEDQAPAEVVIGDHGFVSFTDDAGNRGAGVWMPRGEQGGVLAVAVRAGDTANQPPLITMWQAQINVAPSGNGATLRYTIEMVDGSGTPLERVGPFTAVGERVSWGP